MLYIHFMAIFLFGSYVSDARDVNIILGEYVVGYQKNAGFADCLSTTKTKVKKGTSMISKNNSVPFLRHSRASWTTKEKTC